MFLTLLATTILTVVDVENRNPINILCLSGAGVPKARVPGSLALRARRTAINLLSARDQEERKNGQRKHTLISALIILLFITSLLLHRPRPRRPPASFWALCSTQLSPLHLSKT